jgi:perosamine synthetase
VGMKIPITKPYFGEEERRTILEPLESGWVVQGPKVAEFERRFAEFTGAKFAIATSSCTSALHLSLAALGIGPGDEVLLPSFTFVATANAVEYTGATPVLCDIDLNSFNIDVGEIKKRITHRTKAILPVHLFGLSAQMAPIQEIAEQHGLRVIEDAACGFGTYYRGRHVGNFGTTGCFSFHPRKAITTGEGGMITTSDPDLMATFRSLRDHGALKSDLLRHVDLGGSLLPEFTRLGYNYRLTDLQAALGVAQMKAADQILEARRARALKYHQKLKDEAWMKTPDSPPDQVHSFQSYVCLLCPLVVGGPKKPEVDRVMAVHQKRNQMMNRLGEKGIAVRQGTHAVHTLGYYQKKYRFHPEDFMNAFIADRVSITLPLYVQMTDEEQDLVIRELKTCAESLGF